MVTNSVAEGETDSVADNACMLSAELFGLSRTFGDSGRQAGSVSLVSQGFRGRSHRERAPFHQKCGRAAIWPSAAKLFGSGSATLFVIDSEVLTQ